MGEANRSFLDFEIREAKHRCWNYRLIPCYMFRLTLNLASAADMGVAKGFATGGLQQGANRRALG